MAVARRPLKNSDGTVSLAGPAPPPRTATFQQESG